MSETITALVHTTPEQAEYFRGLPGTAFIAGEWSEDAGFVAYDEGPVILASIGMQLHYRVPDWDELSDHERHTIIMVAAGSPRWRHLGEVYGHRLEEALEGEPLLRAKFMPIEEE